MPSALTTGPAGHVERVIDGDTVEMKTGRRVRLLGIQAPEIAHGNTPAMPMAEAATRTLKSLVEDEKLQLFYDTTRRDKYDRTLAHLVRKRDGTWINRIMLTRGMARVMSFPDNRTVISSLLKAEAEARNAERGLWALPAYQVKTPESIKSAEEGFHIVAGRLVDAARVRERIYLNFEENWREDFTLRIRKKSTAGVFEIRESRDGPGQAHAAAHVRGLIHRYQTGVRGQCRPSRRRHADVTRRAISVPGVLRATDVGVRVNGHR